MPLTMRESALEHWLELHDEAAADRIAQAAAGVRVHSIEDAVAFIDSQIMHRAGEEIRALIGTGEDLMRVFEDLAAALHALTPLSARGPRSTRLIADFFDTMSGEHASLRLA